MTSPHDLRNPGSRVHALSLSVASLFLSACAGQKQGQATADLADLGSDELVKCVGVNECKGQGQCAMKDAQGADVNVCGGQNQCAGKGWMELSLGACQDAGGTVQLHEFRTQGGCEANEANGRLADGEAAEAYNLKSGLAISGYDPVAYFPEGGSQPKLGAASWSAKHGGVTYHFVNAENRQRFIDNPARYEPAFGGWCAYAMGKTGRKVKVDPESFKIEDEQLLLFYRTRLNDTRSKWNEDDHARLRRQADSAWFDKTGECDPVS